MKIKILCCCVMLITAGCAIDPYTGDEKVSNTAIGAGIGAASGAAIGAAADGGSGAWKGAIAGTAAGAGIGYYMDRQEKILRLKLERSGVRVQREGDNLRLIMPSSVTFNSGEYTIKNRFYDVLQSVATVFNEFDETMVEISGHTDTTGGAALNQRLSEQRAGAVAGFLRAQGVNFKRMFVQGFGPSQPIASNASAQGRQVNRRVEIRLLPRAS